MGRKTVKVSKLIVAQSEIVQKELQKLEEAKSLLTAAEQEDQNKLKEVKNQVEELARKNDVFIGVILSPANVLEVLHLALTSRGNVTLPFQVFHQPEREDKSPGK